MGMGRELKKIVLIGPVYPFKGGISHYTSLMCSALRKKYLVTMVSYKFQYPKILYKKEQKDFQNDSFKVNDTNYWLHTANPLIWIKTAKQIKKENADLLIIQWWHPYFAPCYWTICKMLRRTTKILFICHNVFPHERFPLDKSLTKCVLRQGDFYITHSKSDAEDLLSSRADAKYLQAVHPTYNVFRLQNLSKNEARALLSFDNNSPMLLFFGLIREYKGLKHLLKAMPEIQSTIPNVKLFIVGDFGDDKADYLRIINELNIEKFIEVIDGYVPDNEVEKYFAACDLVILPYESATQSGVVQIAYGFEKPVVVTNVGGLPDVVEDGKTGYVVEPLDPKAIAAAVSDFFAESKAQEFEINIKNEEQKYSWDRMVENIGELYEKE
jgi:glycosyltransferase involved in cell wall biosynthesis